MEVRCRIVMKKQLIVRLYVNAMLVTVREMILQELLICTIILDAEQETGTSVSL